MHLTVYEAERNTPQVMVMLAGTLQGKTLKEGLYTMPSNDQVILKEVLKQRQVS